MNYGVADGSPSLLLGAPAFGWWMRGCRLLKVNLSLVLFSSHIFGPAILQVQPKDLSVGIGSPRNKWENISGVFGQVSEKTTDRPSQSLGESLDVT